MIKVSISKGNSKLGAIPSVSLPAVVTCPAICRKSCAQSCYAAKLERIHPSVKKAYFNNLNALKESRENYFTQVKAAAAVARFFRWHVSGDIVDTDYLANMVKIANELPHTDFLAFTKCFQIVNDYIDHGGNIPENLHLIFSGWNYEIPNPHNMPESHVIFKDGTTTAAPNTKKCGGDCTACAMGGAGCWTLKKGEQISFDIH